jgi:hypothetical protein
MGRDARLKDVVLTIDEALERLDFCDSYSRMGTVVVDCCSAGLPLHDVLTLLGEGRGFDFSVIDARMRRTWTGTRVIVDSAAGA